MLTDSQVTPRQLSTHKVEVVPVALAKHPNADSLSIAQVFGYPVVVRTADWPAGQLGAYLPPDSVVDVSRPEFAFLAKGVKTHHRVRAVRLRGVQSFGLLIPAPAGAAIGDDVAEHYGVTHYDPEMRSACTGGEAERAPLALSNLSKYDVDSMRRYASVFEHGERVLVTEKIHGANARYAFVDGRMWCGSRSEWKKQGSSNLWWRALGSTPKLETFCRAFPGYVVYGEIYGDVQSLKYGCKKGEVRFAAFDVLQPDGQWSPALFGRTIETYGVPVVPLLAVMPFDFDVVCSLAEGPSTVPGANHVREGCVVKPIVERFHQAIGRVQLKVVGAGYLETDQ